MFHLGRILRERLAGSTEPRDRGLLNLTWDYPTHGPTAEPSADAVLHEINGHGPDGPLSTYTELKADGSTSCGVWIYCGVGQDGVNQAARRTPRLEAVLGGARVGLGLAREPAHPLQPGLGGSRRQAVVGAQAVRLVGRRPGRVDRRGRPRLHQDEGSRLRAARRRPRGRRAQGQRAVRDAVRRPRLAVRARGRGRRPAADALRAARVAGRERVLRAAGQPGARHLVAAREPLQPVGRPSRLGALPVRA